MKILNEEKFKEFLSKNLKAETYNYNAYLEDLETQYGNSGSEHYELNKNETKSGIAETIRFNATFTMICGNIEVVIQF